MEKIKCECPECGVDYFDTYNGLEAHFDGSQTWILCTCGFDSLLGDGDLIDQIAFDQEAE